MRYKSAIIWLSTIVSALCIFFLSFTWKAGQLRDQANTYATSKDGKFDPAKDFILLILYGSNLFISDIHSKKLPNMPFTKDWI